jgi:hypothetical protein
MVLTAMTGCVIFYLLYPYTALRQDNPLYKLNMNTVARIHILLILLDNCTTEARCLVETLYSLNMVVMMPWSVFEIARYRNSCFEIPGMQYLPAL